MPRIRTRRRATAAALLMGVLTATGAAHARSQTLAAAPAPTLRVADSRAAPVAQRWGPDQLPFASSLQIAPPGPQPEANGLSYRLRLTWSARAGASAYRVFMWTDAARTWYKVAQTTGANADAHAFRSGCTAFMVIAFADTNTPDASMTGLEATSVLRFPLSQQPTLCPTQHP